MEGFAGLFIAVAVVILVVQAGLGTARFFKNESSPQVREAASLVRKKRVSNGENSVVYDAYFDVRGQELKCRVPRRVYRELEEGAAGFLTHQGTRFYSFEFHGITVSK